jgi:hypothetical protein
MSLETFFKAHPMLEQGTRVVIGGTLMLAATASFKHNISMVVGLLGFAVPSEVMGALLAVSAVGILLSNEQETSEQQQIKLA